MLRAYLQFRRQAVDAHGIHSPFVYQLYTEVLHPNPMQGENAPPSRLYPVIHAKRQQALRDASPVPAFDLGAGSQHPSHKQTVGGIAKNAPKPTRQAQLLARLVNHFKPAQILELGTSLGFTTAYLAAAHPTARITTIEGNPHIAALAQSLFEQLSIANITLEIGNIDQRLPQYLQQLPSAVDFVFFDGNHRLRPTMNYFEQCLLHANSSSVFVFDDIHWSPEMQHKQHFSIRI